MGYVDEEEEAVGTGGMTGCWPSCAYSVMGRVRSDRDMAAEVFVTVLAVEAGDSMCVCVCSVMGGEGTVVVLVQEQGVA